MTPVRVRLDFRELDRKAGAALGTVAARVGTRTQVLMHARTWAWPNTTERANGTQAGTLRDIVDTGTLARSQSDPKATGPLNYTIIWDADYAAAVFLGAVFRKRAYSMPARNAPLAALRSLNLSVQFAQAWRQA